MQTRFFLFAHHIIKVPAVPLRDIYPHHEPQLRQHAGDRCKTVLVERRDSALLVLYLLVVRRTYERPVRTLIIKDTMGTELTFVKQVKQ